MAKSPDARDSTNYEKLEEIGEKLDKLADPTADLTNVDPVEGDSGTRTSLVESYFDDKDHKPRTQELKRDSWNDFAEWFERSDLTYLSELEESNVVEWKDWLRDTTDRSDFTIKKDLERVKTVLRWCATRSYVRDDLGDWAEHYPHAGSKQRENILTPKRGERVADWVREEEYASRLHIEWILIWHLGLRRSACIALDADGFHYSSDDPECDCAQGVDGPHLRLRHRPEFTLNLKKRGDEEPSGRYIPLRERHAEAIRRYNYVAEEDQGEHGLVGLLRTSTGTRISGATLRQDAHYLTNPTSYAGQCDCDHCSEHHITRTNADGCERSVPPHGCRHGAITNMMDTVHSNHNASVEGISTMVGTSVSELRRTYDHDTPERRYKRHCDEMMTLQS